MFTIPRSLWKASCLGLTLAAMSQARTVGAAPPPSYPAEISISEAGSPAASPNAALINAMIDDARQDGVVSVQERNLIMSQARRYLAPSQVAEIDNRLGKGSTRPITLQEGAANGQAESLPAPGMAGDGYAAAMGGCCDDARCGGLFNNMYLFGNAEGWQGPVDDDANPNNFGVRAGFNMGFPLLECWGIGGQVGVSAGFYNFHGRGNAGGDEGSSVERHFMNTLGIFQRADLCSPCPRPWSWGIAYDRLYAERIGEEADTIYIGQWRLQFGYALSETDEVGFWTTQGNESDRLLDLGSDVHPLHQYNVYWDHHWCIGADTRWWIGLAEDPGSVVFGASSNYPLNDCLALTATAQYIHPSSGPGEKVFATDSGFEQEFWNIAVGIAWYPSGGAQTKTVAGHRWMPYFNVADNGSFALETNGD